MRRSRAPGYDVFVRPVPCECHPSTGDPPMNRYVAPLGFTLAAVWVVVIFVLVNTTH